MKKQGSSLILVMLVVAGITTVIFGTQRVSLVQFSQSAREEDNILTHHAAKAGIEDGLARFRYNRNVETERDVASQSNKVFRFNITKATYLTDGIGQAVDIDEKTPIAEDPNYDPSHQYYDLKINYRERKIGMTNTRDPIFDGQNRLEKDESLTLTGFPSTVDYYTLRYVFKVDSGCTDKDKAFAQLTQIFDNGATGSSAQAFFSEADADGIYSSSVRGQNMEIKTTTNHVSRVRVRAYYCPFEYAFTTSLTTGGRGNGSNAGPEFDSLRTVIVSTGYYGSAKRSLVAEIDRQSGTLLGIYDFNLYAARGDIRRR